MENTAIGIGMVGNCDGLQCLVYNLAKSKKSFLNIIVSTEEKPIAAKVRLRSRITFVYSSQCF